MENPNKIRAEAPQTIYQPEKEEKREKISLTESQKESIRGITLGIEEVDEAVRSMAIEDVIKTLENGHPLNRIIADQENNIIGYIACEDFIPHEAYIKYLATTGAAGRNLLKEIPAFLEYAKQQGYTKINFHGWNERLNHVMERYGFERLRTDKAGNIEADFYEKTLIQQKSSEVVEKERINAFEQKYLNKINQDYRQTLTTFSEENRQTKEQSINDTFQVLSGRFAAAGDFEFSDRQKAILKLKLARHFQGNDAIDSNTLYDAIIESPRFINTDKGSLHRLLEVHEEKTLQKIAEMRKQRAEMGDKESFNPYENLFTTKSGNYYMARLLNMPHLEKESEYMEHCVGTSNSYVNKIKKGEVEILSFRKTPKINPDTQKLEGDIPIITIEYNLKTSVIEQIKKQNDEYLKQDDPYFNDVVDALKQLRATKTDVGDLRDFSKISSSELRNIKVKDYHILTEQGEVSFRDFNPDAGIFVLKTGFMEITPEISKEDAAKMLKIVDGVECQPNQVAYNPQEITENTKAYVGKLEPGIFNLVQKYNIEHIYTSFPEGKIKKMETEITGKSGKELEKELKAKNINISDYAHDMLEKLNASTPEHLDLVQLTVNDLGFPNGATTDEIYKRAEKLGLELCPQDTGPNLRLQNSTPDYMIIAMKQITDRDDHPDVFYLHRNEDGLWLRTYWAVPGSRRNGGRKFVFRLRKLETGKL